MDNCSICGKNDAHHVRLGAEDELLCDCCAEEYGCACMCFPFVADNYRRIRKYITPDPYINEHGEVVIPVNRSQFNGFETVREA